jgi:hypothetical protein
MAGLRRWTTSLYPCEVLGEKGEGIGVTPQPLISLISVSIEVTVNYLGYASLFYYLGRILYGYLAATRSPAVRLLYP